VHRPSDRVKDVSPWREESLIQDPRVGCSRFVGGELTTFPSSAFRRAPTVTGATARRGGDPCVRAGPIKTLVPPTSREGRRLSEDQMLSTDAITGAPEDHSSRLPVPASRSRRPHVFPRLGKGAFSGIASAPGV
jgi:hypothetical protein